MTKIVYIHGASATSDSFNYIREHIRNDDMVLEYSSLNRFVDNLETMKEQLSEESDIFFVAHSLGGIYALHLADHYSDRVRGAVTISTPYGGSREADVAKWFLPFNHLMRDIGPDAYPMRQARKISVPCPWTNIVTVRGGSPFISEANDGVVTLESMRKHSSIMDLIELNLNHYEVLLSGQTVDVIKSRLDNKQSK